MSPSKLAPEQRSAQLAQFCHEKMPKTARLIVAEAMRLHGGPAISAAKQNLQQLGFIDHSGKIVKPFGLVVLSTSPPVSRLASSPHYGRRSRLDGHQRPRGEYTAVLGPELL